MGLPFRVARGGRDARNPKTKSLIATHQCALVDQRRIDARDSFENAIMRRERFNDGSRHLAPRAAKRTLTPVSTKR